MTPAKFTVMGHACLFIEAAGKTILIDPWLSGSCYWRSWWQFPPAVDVTDTHLNVDYVLISHYHFDHMHYPSLRRIAKTAQVFIPRFGVDIMGPELRTLGFDNVTEMPHGEVIELPDGLRLASYQYGFDDSAFVVADDEVTLADLNDCKIKGRTAKAVLKSFGSPTFMFKSHSWAMAYPACYSAEDQTELGFLTPEDYLRGFFEAVDELSPRYAVPFASMVGFLHPESMHCNAYKVTALAVKNGFVASAHPGTELVLMSPGDTWEDAQGFRLSNEDFYTDSSKRLERQAATIKPKIDQSLAEEARQTLPFSLFQGYFADFLRALPKGLGRFVARPQVFHMPSAPEPYWIVDFRRREVRQDRTLPADWASLLEVPEGILADAIRNRVVNFLHISMRLKVRLAAGGSKSIFRFWAFLTIYELGYFPVRRLLTPRALGVWRRRWAEFFDDYLANFLRGKSVEDVRFKHAARGKPLQ